MIAMPDRHISVTAAARGFSDLINRIRYRGESAILVKNGAPVARIGPFVPPRVPATAAGLASRLVAFTLDPEDRDRFSLQVSLARSIWD